MSLENKSKWEIMDELEPLVPEITKAQVKAWVWFAPLQHFSHPIEWLVTQIRTDYAQEKIKGKPSRSFSIRVGPEDTPETIEEKIAKMRDQIKAYFQ